MSNEQDLYRFILSECKRLGINESSYKVGDQVTPELSEIAFFKHGQAWKICTIERGKEYDSAVFDTAFDAVLFFFLKLTVTPTNREYPKINFKDMPE